MADNGPGPDATRVHATADLVRELGLLRVRAAAGTRKTRVSLAELADRISEPRSTVHAYLTGKHFPAATIMDRIVIALGASPAEQSQWSEAWFRVAASQGATWQPLVEIDNGWTRPAPHQLPPDIPGFCGRQDELDQLNRLRTAGPAVMIAALAGGGGVGKSALAVHWAHQIADEFPDGQLWVDLRGFDPDAPLPPGVALAGFLRALGVPGTDIPADLAERAALYRTLLSGRRVLVLLDNAADTEQVRPLLPSEASCQVVVTSRNSLAGLVARHGAHRIDLDGLSEPDALALLRALVGDDRVNAEPDAASELVRRCARLPLALRITAERAVAQPVATVRDLADELADEERLLDVLDAGGDPRTAIRAVFSWSTRHLKDKARNGFRALGVHPGRGFDAAALAALLDTDEAAARAVLTELVAAHLVQVTAADRYGMHDLVHAWAAERAVHDEPELDREGMLARLAAHYLRGAAAAMDVLYPHDKDRRPTVDDPAPPVPDESSARRWLDDEVDAILDVAATTGSYEPRRTIALAATLRRHLETTGRFVEAHGLHEHALTAADRVGDRSAQAGALINLSAVHARTGRYDEAAEHLERATRLCRDVGDTAELARALDNLGTVHGRTGNFTDAAGNFAEALALCRTLGDADGEARALHNLGTVHGITGDYAAAETCFQQALTLCRDLGDPLGEAYAIDNLGSVYCRMARYPESVDCHRKALTLRREHGDKLGTAHALDNLGTAYRAMGANRQALDCHQQSLTVRREIGDLGDEPHALNNLGATLHLLGKPDQAIHHHELALAQCRRTGNRYEQARAHDGLGTAHHDLDQVREHWVNALALYEELGVPEATEIRARLTELG